MRKKQYKGVYICTNRFRCNFISDEDDITSDEVISKPVCANISAFILRLSNCQAVCRNKDVLILVVCFSTFPSSITLSVIGFDRVKVLYVYAKSTFAFNIHQGS